MRNYFKIIFVAALFCFATAINAYAQLKWENIYPGTKCLFHTFIIENKPVRFYAVSIDLKQSKARVLVSSPHSDFKTTSEYAKEAGAQIAVDGGFFDFFGKNFFGKYFGLRFLGKPYGLTVFQGISWPGVIQDNSYGFFAVNKDGHVCISPSQEESCFAPKDIYMAISGRPTIVKQGQLGEVEGVGWDFLKNPRTAVGVDKSGETLFFVVADGRQKDSDSISLKTLAEFMVRIGVWNGLNLDGGGSSTLYIENKGGVVNKPSEGKERTVLNSIMVLIK